jgi:tetratricopeptide (TPR) repeat protein
MADRGEETFQLAVQYEQAGVLDQAERLYRKALTFHPGWLAALNNLGNVLQAVGRLAEAESCYRQALALEPEFAESLFGLGATLLALGREEEAQDCNDRAFALSVAEGERMAAEGRLAPAAAFYERALALRPEDLDLLKRVAALLEAQGKHAEAQEHLKRVRDLEDRSAAGDAGTGRPA